MSEVIVGDVADCITVTVIRFNLSEVDLTEMQNCRQYSTYAVYVLHVK